MSKPPVLTFEIVHGRVLYGTTDSQYLLPLPDGTEYEVPALTTLMYRICKQDHDLFLEATRVVELFIKKTYDIMVENR
jgi:hypothetical protein